MRTDREVIEAAISKLAAHDGEAANTYGAAYEQALQRDDWAGVLDLAADLWDELDQYPDARQACDALEDQFDVIPK